MQGRGAVAVVLTVLVCFVAGDNSACEYDNCSECISVPSCIWCSNLNITSEVGVNGETLLQCINKKVSPNRDKFLEACKYYIQDPPTVEMPMEDDLPGTSGKLLSPQRIKLKMRAGESTRINLKYVHHIDYPMDLYCLMDGSKSMTSLKTQLSEVTSDLVQGLTNITDNVKLGFGMFVDKPTLPYTDMNTWSHSVCQGCTETFSFKNILPLTHDQKTFQEKVYNAPSSTNTDKPEGTLEALMQVASCSREVGWRKEALKVAVVFTDAGFHLAGDGRFAGIVKPNDRMCHLDSDGDYTHSLWQDYPSVSELKSALEENGVTTIFAVWKDQVSLYQLLAEMLHSASCSDMDNNSDIVNLIVNPVKDKIRTVTLRLKEIVSGVKVEVSSKCKGGAEQKTDTCKEMLSNDKAEFFLDIKIEKCPSAVEDQNVIMNFELDDHSQNFFLDLEMACQCKCDVEEDKDFIANADVCNKQGDLRCGACDCHDGFTGKKCQCMKGEEDSQGIDEENCIQPNSTTTEICNGQGKCVCGLCECDKRKDPSEIISGRYCQCTNYHKDCQGNNGEICSGNGECICNKCSCKDGWKEPVCSCSTDTGNCINTEGEICSNNGECVCNRCECNEDYEGKHCQNCKYCEAKCEQHRDCVECLVFKAGMYTEADCEVTCSSYKVNIISDMTKEYGFLCSNTDEKGCRFFYQYKENGTEVHVWAQNQKECPKVINPWVVAGGVLAGVVLVGLLLLLGWRVFATVKDARECRAFEEDKKKSVWSENQNPLYKGPVTEVKNPLFERTGNQR